MRHVRQEASQLLCLLVCPSTQDWHERAAGKEKVWGACVLVGGLCSINSQGRGVHKYYSCLGWLALPLSLMHTHSPRPAGSWRGMHRPEHWTCPISISLGWSATRTKMQAH